MSGRRPTVNTLMVAGSAATLLVLCAGGILLYVDVSRLAGVLVLILAGCCALYVVPFLLLVWIFRR